MSTIFSKIINRELPSDIVFENERILAFRDIAPQAPHHILIIPKKEIPGVNELSAEDAALVSEILFTAQHLAKTLQIAESGYRLVFNCNADGGQAVPHLHCHLLGGRSMSWPPG